jgi:hypothetical protein
MYAVNDWKSSAVTATTNQNDRALRRRKWNE